MRFNELDKAASGNKPLTNCVRWLRTCLSACTSWTPEQRIAASQAADEAEVLLETELSPNVTAEELLAPHPPQDGETPLQKLLQRWREEGAAATYRDLLALNLYESALLEQLDASQRALREIGIRVAFIGWPAETFWDAGKPGHPHWVPDWRKEIGLIHAALHQVAVREAPDQPQTLPWNCIPEEHRPGHMEEGKLRLQKLHLAWLRYRESAGEDDGTLFADRLLALKEDMQSVFERAPVAGGSLTLKHRQAMRQ